MRRRLPLIANITVVWAVLFAVVHAYWAAGGSAGVHHPADSAGAQVYIAFVAMLGLAAARQPFSANTPSSERKAATP